MSDDPRIQAMLQDVAELRLPDAERDAIIDDLNCAIQINGDTTPTQVMFKRMLLSNARQTLLLHKSLRRMQADHMQQCPVMKAAVVVNGTTIMPWDISKTSADAEGQSCITIPVLNVTVKGKAARYVGVGAGLALLLAVAILLTNAATRKSVIADIAQAYSDRDKTEEKGE